MITLTKAKTLTVGQIIFHTALKNADGTAMRLKVNGAVRVWKRDKKRLKVPLRRGLYESGYLTNGTSEGGQFSLILSEVSLASNIV